MHISFALAAITTSLTSALVIPAATAHASAPLCFGKPATIVARGGYVPGTAGPDVIVIRGGGSAEVHSFGGRDRICGASIAYGGSGHDLIAYNNSSGRAHEIEIGGGPGYDRIVVAGTSRTYGDVVGGPGNDTITTGPGAQTVSGGYGDDDLRTGMGPDTVVGGPGTDFIGGGAGIDTCDAEVMRNCEG